MEKYRVVRHKNHLLCNVHYTIEKRRRFLWWVWWADLLIIEDMANYFTELTTVNEICSKLNAGQKNTYEKNVV